MRNGTIVMGPSGDRAISWDAARCCRSDRLTFWPTETTEGINWAVPAAAIARLYDDTFGMPPTCDRSL